MEEPLGLEPRTPCLKGRCSNQLSYGSVNFSNVQALCYVSIIAYWLEHQVVNDFTLRQLADRTGS